MSAVKKFRTLNDHQWLNLLVHSITEPRIMDVDFPSFPANELQAKFVGSSNQHALQEAYNFYSYMKMQAFAVGNPLNADSRTLDFGCGWGRFMRFFWKDVEEENLYGVDVRQDIIDICQSTGIKGQLEKIEPLGSINLPDASISHVLSYSVFTHLPKNIHIHWMNEMKRLIRKGGILAMTLESRRFLEFVSNLKNEEPSSPWHQGLKLYANQATDSLSKFDEGEFVFLNTGGGDLSAIVYGDAAVPLSFIKEYWEPEFKVIDYVDDPNRFWQAAIVLQRT